MFPDGRTEDGCLIVLALSGILRAVKTLQTVFDSSGEGKRTVRSQGEKCPFSARQIVPGHFQLSSTEPWSNQLPSSGEEPTTLVKGISVVVLSASCLSSLLELVLHVNQQGQQPAHATHFALSSQDALITTQINTLLMQEATLQHFSGSVLLAHHDSALEQGL